jgi:hypothetical protein
LPAVVKIDVFGFRVSVIHSDFWFRVSGFPMLGTIDYFRRHTLPLFIAFTCAGCVTPSYRYAVVSRETPWKKQGWQQITITNPTDVKQLASYFPCLRYGFRLLRWDQNCACRISYQVTFYGKGENVDHVSNNSEKKPGVDEYIDHLYAIERPVATDRP